MASKKKLSVRARVRLAWASLGTLITSSADWIAHSAAAGVDIFNSVATSVFPQAQMLLGQSQTFLDPQIFHIAGGVIFAMAMVNLFLGAWIDRRKQKKADRLAKSAEPTQDIDHDEPANG